MTGSIQCVAERIAREVDRHEPDGLRGRLEAFETGTLLRLRRGMIDLEHIDIGKFLQSPCPSVEPGTEDHQLWSESRCHRLVDCQRSRHHDLGDGAQPFEVHPFAEALRNDPGTCDVDLRRLVLRQQQDRGRVIEVADVDSAICNSAALAHENCSAAGVRLIHW